MAIPLKDISDAVRKLTTKKHVIVLFSGQALATDRDDIILIEKEGKIQTNYPCDIYKPAPPLGRNDPCHCKSGKKFKHCHGK